MTGIFGGGASLTITGSSQELGDFIELGCGPYTNTRLILKGRRAGRVVCSDPLADEYLKFGSRWLARAHRRGHVEIDTHPIEECPFPERSFDVVVLRSTCWTTSGTLRSAWTSPQRSYAPGGSSSLAKISQTRTRSSSRVRMVRGGPPHPADLQRCRSMVGAVRLNREQDGPARDPRLQRGVLVFAGRKS